VGDGMNRRRFLKASAVTSGLVMTSGGIAWLSISEASGPVNIEFLLNQLDDIIPQSHRSIGEWELAKILVHCAQSVEYSFEGYPQHKSELFKQTIGSVAFALFESKKKMTHDLTQPIAGAPEVANNQSVDEAVERLRKALVDFNNYQGKLAPHFAYGELSKQQYGLAHVMHFNNHWSEVVAVPG
jgi:hypothetical protein